MRSAIYDPDFIAAHRVSSAAFSRQRTLTFPIVVTLLLRGLFASLQVELDSFFPCLDASTQLFRSISASAFSQAREKLLPSAFSALNQLLIKTVEPLIDQYRWHGHRLVAGDGIVFNLPLTADIIDPDAFDCYCQDGQPSYSLARSCTLMLLGPDLFLDSQLASDRCGERSLLGRQLDRLDPTDILVLDAGFPSHQLFATLSAMARHFCIRMPLTSWHCVEAFVQSGQREITLELKVPTDTTLSESTPRHYPLRLIRVDLPSGPEVLATSLLDGERYPATDFAELYHKRWSIESGFLRIKQHHNVESFSGRTAHAVAQEIQAAFLLANLVQLAAISAEAAETECTTPVTADSPSSKRRKINRSYTLSALRQVLPSWLLRAVEAAERFIENLRRNRVSRGADRSRDMNGHPPRHPSNRKQI